MLILGLAPIIDYAVTVLLMRANMYFDSGKFTFPKDGEVMTSKAKTVQKLINTYSGPMMLFHYRYAIMMVSIFTTMIFGVGLPILFPIALMNLCL